MFSQGESRIRALSYNIRYQCLTFVEISFCRGCYIQTKFVPQNIVEIRLLELLKMEVVTFVNDQVIEAY